MSQPEKQSVPVADRPAHRAGPAPSGAERARTLLEFASSVVVDVPGADLRARPGIAPLVECTVLPDGALALLVERSSALLRIVALAPEDQVPAELEAVDVAPVALPHRIRGRVHAHGRLSTTGPVTDAWIEHLFPRHPADGLTLLRFELDHLAVDDLRGTECCVGLDAFTAAEPDPVAAEEAVLLQHLAAAHPDHLWNLAAGALDGPAALTSWRGAGNLRAVSPVAMDRYGLRLRLFGEQDGRMLDARFEFHRPVTAPEDLPEAVHRLFAG
ncbi:DUF2470 domain-containing protein [Kitasatospora camelliae]|uniref:DUF2470 domain-containing protein n=1 Tax=Kitasatospora camelliae TaxID=3156397 RepID=A0AAU8JT34_9ACTN